MLACIFPVAAQTTTDLSDHILVSTSNERTTLDRATGRLISTVDVRLSNLGGKTLVSPLHCVVNLSTGGVTVVGAEGGYGAGPYQMPYVDLTPLMPEGRLEAKGEILVTLSFSRPRHVAFTYELQPRGEVEGGHLRIISDPTTDVQDGHVYTYTVESDYTGAGALTYRLLQAPTGMTIDAASGLVRWVPGKRQAGQHAVEVRAEDDARLSDTQTYEINVERYNYGPVITSLPDRYAKAGEPYRYDVKAYDPDGDIFVFDLGDRPSGMTVDPASGLVTWTPDFSFDGSNVVVQVVARDDRGAASTQTYSVVVYDPGFELEVLSPVGSTSVVAGTTLELEMRANHPRAGFEVSPLPRNALVSGNRFIFPTEEGAGGTHPISFLAKFDDQFAQSIFVVHVVHANRGPTIEDPGRQEVMEGAALAIPLTMSDPDGDALTVTPANAWPQGCWYDSITREIHFQPDYGQAGEHAIAIRVSDGKVSADATAVVKVDKAPSEPVTQLDLVLDGIESPTLRSRVNITGNVRGEPGQPAPVRPPMLIVSLQPDAGGQGQTGLVVEVSSINTDFAAGLTAASFGDGVTVENVLVTSPTSAAVTVSVSPLATLGLRRVYLTSAGESAYSVVAFNVIEGVSAVRGRLVDSMTGQPVGGARVSLYGSDAYALTDADGWFTLDRAVGGPNRLIVTRPDYEPMTLDLAVNRNETLVIEEPLFMRSIAVPIHPGGSLPRAATLASILDRGASDPDPSMTVEQAKLLIIDTLITIGGSEVGVLDEAGSQLNSSVTGSGLLSLNPEGVRRLAESMVQGNSVTLREFLSWIREGFDWGGVPPAEVESMTSLQVLVNEAWSEPNAPESAIVLAMFSPGRALSLEPPVLTPDLRLNRLQLFIAMNSFLLSTRESLDRSITSLLEDRGIDYRSHLPADVPAAKSARSPPVSAPASVRMAMERADADSDYDIQKRRSIAHFSRIGKAIAAGLIADATASAIGGVALSLGLAVALGAGLSGVVVLGAMAAGVSGAATTMIFKLLTLVVATKVATSLDPGTAKPLRNTVTADNRIIIHFDRSPGDTNRVASESFLIKYPAVNFAYTLYRFTNATDLTGGKPIPYATVAPDLSDPANFDPERPRGRLMAVLPAGPMPEGDNHFRIKVTRFIRNCERSAVEALSDFDRDGDGYLIYPDEFDGTRERFDSMDADKNGRLSSVEFGSRYSQVFSMLPPELNDTAGQGFDSAMGAYPIDSMMISKETYDDLLAERMAALEPRVDPISGNLIDHDRAIDMLSRETQRRASELKAFQGDFKTRHADTLKNTAEALGYLGQAEPNPANPDRVRVSQLVKRNLTDAEWKAFTDYAASVNRQRILSQAADFNRGQRQALEEAWRVANDPSVPPGQETSFLYRTMDEDGRITTHTARLFAGDPDTILAHTKYVDDVSGILAPLSIAERNRMAAARSKAYDIMVPEFEPYRRDVARKIVSQQASARQWNNSVKFKEKYLSELELGVRSEAGGILGPGKKDFTDVKAGGSGIKSFLGEMFGYSLDVTEVMFVTLNSVRVLEGEFSSCITVAYKRPATAAFLPRIEPYGSRGEDPGVFLTEVVTADGAKGLTRMFPSSPERWDSLRFASDWKCLVAGRYGNIYMANMDSNLEYGGRLHRMALTQRNPLRVSVEHVGNIRYYSSFLQAARPAYPVAMCVGPAYTGAGESGPTQLEDLYIADVDFTKGSNRLMRLPVSEIDLKPSEHPPGNRHLVAEEILASRAFRFDGPVEMEVAPDPTLSAGLYMAQVTKDSPMLVADQAAVFAIHNIFSGGPLEFYPFIFIEGRQWSGMAFDLVGNFYVADSASGTIFMIKRSKFNDLLLGRSKLENNDDLRRLGYVVAENLGKIGDIEVEPISLDSQHMLVASSGTGFTWIPFPVVAKDEDVGGVIRLMNPALESDGVLLRGRRSEFNPAQWILPLDVASSRRSVVRLAFGDDGRGEAVDLHLATFGVTILDRPFSEGGVSQ